jgi:hypothetical protein
VSAAPESGALQARPYIGHEVTFMQVSEQVSSADSQQRSPEGHVVVIRWEWVSKGSALRP